MVQRSDLGGRVQGSGLEMRFEDLVQGFGPGARLGSGTSIGIRSEDPNPMGNYLRDYSIRQAKAAHDGPVLAIGCVSGGKIVSGGKDRRIVEWNENLQKTGKEFLLPDHAGSVRSVTAGKGSLLLVGTAHNCILEGSLDLQHFGFLINVNISWAT